MSNINKIVLTIEEIEARKHVLFGDLYSGLINKAEDAAWEGVTAAVNEVGQKYGTVADINKKLSGK